jgi:DNA-binding SARP family transcriptional activator
MSNRVKKLSSDALRILHGARSLPPVEAAEALRPFLTAMHKEHAQSKLAEASTDAVTELVRSLSENHAASNDLWEEAIEATLSFVNERG